jgi:hypothetical protein
MKYLETERFRLAGIVAGMVVFGGVCLLMIVDGWSQRDLAWHSVYGLVGSAGLGVDTVFVFPVGLFLGLCALVLLDDYKRIQGLVLWSLILVGSVILYFSGVYVTRIDWTNGSVLVSLLVGSLVGVFLGGFRLDELESEVREFPKAINYIFFFAAVTVFVAFIEASIAYQSPIVTTPNGFETQAFAFGGLSGDMPFLEFLAGGGKVMFYLLSSVIFLGTLRGFRDYRTDRSIVVLGPTGSGKTTLIAGLEMTQRKTAERNGDLTTRANPLLMQMSDDIEWDRDFSRIGSTQEVQPFKFRFTKGNLIKKMSTLRAIDHSGQDLTQFTIGGVGPAQSAEEAYKIACVYHDSIKGEDEPDALETHDSDYRSTVREIKNGELEFEELLPDWYVDEGRATSGPELTRNLVSDMVEHSDVVVLLLPMEDFLDEEDVAEYMGKDWIEGRPSREKRDYLHKYVELLQRYEDKEIVFVATMADLATEVFVDSSYEYTMVDPNRQQNWTEFTSFVEDRISQAPGALGQYLNTLNSSNLGDGDIICPVYYNVEVNDGDEEINLDLKGEMSPMRGAYDVLEEVGG